MAGVVRHEIDVFFILPFHCAARPDSARLPKLARRRSHSCGKKKSHEFCKKEIETINRQKSAQQVCSNRRKSKNKKSQCKSRNAILILMSGSSVEDVASKNVKNLAL